MDPVIESKVVEDKFTKVERRRMVRARKIDAAQYVRVAWGSLATTDELARMMGAASPEATDRGLSGKDVASLVAALASGGGSVVANPAILKGGLVGITALTLAYPVARRRWRRWSRRRSVGRVEGDLLLLRSAVVLFLADRLYGVLTSNDGLGHLEALLHQPQQSSESKRLAWMMHEGVSYSDALARSLHVRARSDTEVMAQAGALRATVLRLHDVICKALATPWSTEVKKGAARGAYKLWDRFVDDYLEHAGGPKLWGGGDPLAGLTEKLPEFPGG